MYRPQGGMPQVSTGMLPPGPIYQPMPQAPNTGLIGREQALRGGFDAAMAALDTRGGYGGGGGGVSYSHINDNRDMALGQVRQGVDAAMPMVNRGISANDTQAALSGAMGPEAQRQAYAQFQSSPGYQYQMEQMERALTRNAAATGGLQGGNILQALQRNAAGLAAQDFQNYYNRLGNVADRGNQALGYQTQLRGVGANAATAAGGQIAGLQGAQVGASASMANARLSGRVALQRDAANHAMRTGELRAQGRTDAGSALASLYEQQGSGMGGIYGQGLGAIGSIYATGGENQYNSDAARAALLSNINMGGASTVAGLPTAPYTTQSPGFLSNVGNSMNDLMQPVGNAVGAWNAWNYPKKD